MTLLAGFVVCLFLSAFFSAVEMAFLSSDRVKVRDEAERGNARARKILSLFGDSRLFLTTLLIGNNLVNITATALFAAFLKSRFEIQNEWIVTAILAPMIIIFTEIVPKGYGRHRRRELLVDHSGAVIFFARLLAWPSRLLLRASEICLGGKEGSARKNIFVSEDEFRFLIEESVREGVLEENERKLVERILDFERIPVERVLIPVAKVPRVELSRKVKDVREEAKRTGSRVVLVYEEIPSIVVGMIYVFDLLFVEDEDKGLREYLRSPIFLFKDISLEAAFLTLQERRQSFALVTDSRQEVIGLVHIENLLAI
jgi:CBS domain containing-hemolysin-like protein